MKISIQDYINQTPFSAYQKLIFFMTFLVAFFDGYDTAVIGYIAPSLLQEWGIARPHLAPVLSAALLGLACGAIGSGPVADRFGRKYLLIVSVALFAMGSLISAQVDTLTELERWRFITGIGLGAAMPNAVTLLSEYCPQHQRARIVNTMFCGFPLGAALGGFIASYLIPEFGWRSTLIFGGTLPLVLSVLMIFIFPESVRFLASKIHASASQNIVQLQNISAQPLTQAPISTPLLAHTYAHTHAHIRTILAKFKGASLDNIDYSLYEESQATGQGIKVVLSRHYVLGSILLWICYFMGLVIFYGVINWMPVLLGQSAMSEGTAKQIVGLFALGGVGAIASGYLMDRYNVNYLNAGLALLTMISIGMMGWSLQWGVFALVIVVLFAGVVMNTLQASLPTVAALFYPTQGRTTGVSWMMGIGRFGGVAGSYLVAELVRREFALEQVFFCLAIPAGVMAICLYLKQYIYQR